MAAGAEPRGPGPGAEGGEGAAEGGAEDDAKRIHNIDQRAPIVEFGHPALPQTLRLEQHGAHRPGFVQGTSSVAWPCAPLLARHLCAHPELIRGRSVVELGAGLGLVGAVAAALGASPTVLTDCEGALPLLLRNRERLEEIDASVDVARVDWGSEADHAALLQARGAGFDVVLGSDVVVGGFDTDKLFASCLALLSRAPGAVVLLAYEYRDEWESIGNFIHRAEEAGLECSHELLLGEDVDEEDCEDFLYTFRWRGSA
mmetsp:Transcript_30101/g.86198  ORF Transcript_30101/g.86198 Transcript_30101/m.86198 type:complete len:258 (+) Transcript_30101:32-805(+)